MRTEVGGDGLAPGGQLVGSTRQDWFFVWRLNVAALDFFLFLC